MEYGISTACFYPGLLDNAVDAIMEWRPPVVELFANTVSEIEPDFIKEVRRKFDSCGTRVVSLHPFTSALEPLLFFSEYERRFYDAIELYKHYFEAAAMLGARYFVFHGDRRDSEFDRRRGYERFALLDEAARGFGLRVAHENVSRCLSCEPEYIRGMREYLNGNVKFVLDLKQCRRGGVGIYDMLEAMGDCVAHLHVSDACGEHTCLPVGSGSFDFGGLVRRLRGFGYDGAFIVELYSNNYSDISELETSIANLRNLLGACGEGEEAADGERGSRA